jgi:hypothetical protein
MVSWFVLGGLIMEIVGVGLLLRDELTPLAARIRQSNAKGKGGVWVQINFWLGRRFGSTDPQDQESYVGESFQMRLLGFFFMLAGFILQAVGIIINLLQA